MDKNTFALLVRESEHALYRVSKSILANESDCADAVQEAILKAYASLDSLKQEQYFKTWLVRILIHECYKIQKSRKQIVPYDEFTVDKSVSMNEDFSELHSAIMGLNEDLRMVVILYYINGFSTIEIARILRIPKGTVNSRMARARKDLKQIIGNERMNAVWIS